MSTSMRRARHRLETGAVRAAAWVLCRLPFPVSLGAGAFLGRLAFSLVRVRRAVTLANLRATLGRDWSRQEMHRVALGAYQNFGRSMVEYCRFPVTRPEDMLRRISFEGLDRLDAALGRGKGVVLVSGHLGNWQILGASLAQRGYCLSYLAIAQHNPGVERIQQRLARSQGVRLIAPGMGMREVLRALARNEIVAILADQDAGSRGIFVDFLGQSASTPAGPVSLALRTGSPIVPAFMVRLKGGRHRLEVRPAIEAIPQGASAEEDLVHYTQRHTDVLAEFVRRYPDQWFWPHRRWKTRPPLHP